MNPGVRLTLRSAVLLNLVFGFSFSVYAQVQTPKYVSMTSNTNGYYEYLPAGYSSGNNSYPLIIFIHGMGELGNGSAGELPRVLNNGTPRVIQQGTFPNSFTVSGQTHRFIVISPQFTSWPSPNDINNVINYATSNYRVNQNRIYVTGLSMGGGVTWEYAGNNATYANRIAAIVPVCGASWPELSRARTIANANLAVWATHNNDDGTVPVFYTNDYITNINQAPSPSTLAKKTVWSSGGHDAWSKTYDPNYRENNLNVYEWMLQYQRGTPVNNTNQPPVANAGSDKTITLPTNSVQLNGSGSDPDGSVTKYKWSKISGPSQYEFEDDDDDNGSMTLENLVAGSYVFRLEVKDNKGATATDDVLVVVNAAIPLPVVSNEYVVIPAKIEAEKWSAMSGVQTENTTDAGAGLNIGWIDNTDWMDYRVTASVAGVYKLKLRLAAPNANSQLQVRKADGTTIATVNVPNTGSYQSWQTIETSFSLAAGQQTLKIISVNNGNWNVNWLEFVLAPLPTVNNYSAIPAKIEAESWSLMQGVQTENTGDVGGGLNNGWINNGDWMDYGINAPASGNYIVRFRIATPYGGAQAQLKKADGTVLTTLGIPNTGGFQKWQTMEATVNLAQGNQTLRLISTNSPEWNINWLEFSQSNALLPSLTTTHIEAENWSAMSGVQAESTTDAGGGLNVGYATNADWMEYAYTAPVSGLYTIQLRVASGGAFFLTSSSGAAGVSINWYTTGGYQIWKTVTASVYLNQGTQTIRLTATESTPNLNWLEITSSPASANTKAIGTTEIERDSRNTSQVLRVYPNPVADRFNLQLNTEYSGVLRVVVSDMKGVAVRTYTLNKGAGGVFQAYLSAQSLSAGSYLLTISAADTKATTAFKMQSIQFIKL